MASRIFLLSFLLISLFSLPGYTQEQRDPITLLPPTQIDHLIHEVSGATAMSHVVELSGYNHDRHKAPEQLPAPLGYDRHKKIEALRYTKYLAKGH